MSSQQSNPRSIHPALTKIDPYTSFLYTPHTITCLVLGSLVLVHQSRVFAPPEAAASPSLAADTSYANIKHGLWAGTAVFLGYSVLQGPTTGMVRPHPAVWRLVHGVMVIYLLILIFMLFQDVGDARQLLKHVYSELGTELPERSYGGDCRLWIPGKGVHWQVIYDTVFDEFVVAHTLGWWGKALIIRDYTMLWTLSIGFEFMEMTFHHMLPNFNECWWDSWILDVAVCNLIGLLTGMATVRYFGSQRYNWRGISEQPTLLDKVKRGAGQFLPYSVDNLDWGVFSSPARCLECLGMIAAFLLFEVNAFFLKYVLWIPPRNPLNTFRLTLLFLLALPAAREYYEFLERLRRGENYLKLGPFAWLGVALAITETLVSIKFGRGMFPEPWPRSTLIAWGTVAGLFTLVMTIWSIRFYSQQPAKRKHA